MAHPTLGDTQTFTLTFNGRPVETIICKVVRINRSEWAWQRVEKENPKAQPRFSFRGLFMLGGDGSASIVPTQEWVAE